MVVIFLVIVVPRIGAGADEAVVYRVVPDHHVVAVLVRVGGIVVDIVARWGHWQVVPVTVRRSTAAIVVQVRPQAGHRGRGVARDALRVGVHPEPVRGGQLVLRLGLGVIEVQIAAGARLHAIWRDRHKPLEAAVLQGALVQRKLYVLVHVATPPGIKTRVEAHVREMVLAIHLGHAGVLHQHHGVAHNTVLVVSEPIT